MLRIVRVALLSLALVVAAFLSGCGKNSNKVTGPTGDTGGEHLLAFVTDRASPGNLEIALYDLDQGGFRSVVGLNSTAADYQPTLSDDGNYVFFTSSRGSGAGLNDLYLYDRLQQGLVATPGLNTPGNETQPAFTHDSVHLAFVRDSLGFGRIKLYEPLGDSLIKLPGIDAPGPWSDAHPAPDLHGDRIAFESGRAGTSITHVYVWQRGSGVLNLPDLVSDSSDVSPSLSSNGRWLAFSSKRLGGVGGYDVYLYDLTTHTFVRTPRLNTTDDDVQPSVSAAGTVIALVRQAPPTTSDLFVWTANDSTRSQPPGLSAPSAYNGQPDLRWR